MTTGMWNFEFASWWLLAVNIEFGTEYFFFIATVHSNSTQCANTMQSLKLSFESVSSQLFIKCEFNFVFLPFNVFFLFAFVIWTTSPAAPQHYKISSLLREIFSSSWYIPALAVFSMENALSNVRFYSVKRTALDIVVLTQWNCTWNDRIYKTKTDNKKHPKYLSLL